MNISSVTRLQLDKTAMAAQDRIAKLTSETLFQSETLHTIMQDKFDYKGDKQNTIYVINAKTGEPEEISVKTSVNRSADGSYMYERIDMYDKDEEHVGRKDYSIVKNAETDKYKMKHGRMDNFSEKYKGIGIRLDQIQIERAIQMKINKIPRLSTSEAILYHMKMGFEPATIERYNLTNLSKVAMSMLSSTWKTLMKSTKEYNCQLFPIIVKSDNDYLFDVNKTKAYMYLQHCIDYIKKNGTYKTNNYICFDNVSLELKDMALLVWKIIIKGHEILPKLKGL
ncbi:hypothetical protein IJ750_00380 [bacterium]|nr:hypothetical protein [bacterium]